MVADGGGREMLARRAAVALGERGLGKSLVDRAPRDPGVAPVVPPRDRTPSRPGNPRAARRS